MEGRLRGSRETAALLPGSVDEGTVANVAAGGAIKRRPLMMSLMPGSRCSPAGVMAVACASGSCLARHTAWARVTMLQCVSLEWLSFQVNVARSTVRLHPRCMCHFL
jgi:hypothetical protein